MRFRGVSIGVVKDVRISEDQKSVIAEVILRQDARQFAVEGSKFSLITPKLGFQGVSGLDTLIDGPYISLLPGPSDGKEKLEFRAQSTSAAEPLDDSSPFLLETDNADSVSPGAAVTYRGLKIGSITKLYFIRNAQAVAIQLNIENRFTHLVRSNSVFWRKIGIQADLGLFGSDIKVGSMDSIVRGGIEIATPQKAGARAKALQKFALLSSAPKDSGKWNPVLN